MIKRYKQFIWLDLLTFASVLAQAGVGLYYLLLDETSQTVLDASGWFSRVNAIWAITNAGFLLFLALRLSKRNKE